MGEIGIQPLNRGTTDAAIEATPVLITWYHSSILTHTKVNR
jgi:hypothetical protein